LKAVPWRHVNSWRCIGCGECCRLHVQLTTVEWLYIAKNYGYEFVGQSIDGFYIRKNLDGYCPFLLQYRGASICTLQKTKPLACRLWPFRISDYPRYGCENTARFTYNNKSYYVYLVPQCSGITYGKPSDVFTRLVVPEFVELRLGLRKNQIYSTRGKNYLDSSIF
jgi:Fe-S-cluster containining protein